MNSASWWPAGRGWLDYSDQRAKRGLCVTVAFARVQAPPDYRWTPGQVEVPVYDGLPYPLWGLTARITRHVVQRATEGAE